MFIVTTSREARLSSVGANGAKLERYSRKRSYLRFMTPGTFFRMILRV